MLEKFVARLFSAVLRESEERLEVWFYEFVSGILPFPGDQWNFDMWIWAPFWFLLWIGSNRSRTVVWLIVLGWDFSFLALGRCRASCTQCFCT
ncbi:hypothetical protein BDV37DRAFT_264129 [Aspergillus pseudonomiae]|uniref:Uncharacterized protein n=1 Tax=Aspergillus pseudonomiae TaxID=1506151 RepID=A0A5N7CX21_9EURO|nr:uncharacterized protein BDV37DRAFT_264129 [Aspergillus pseudonomiae]KAE8398143.1 hypothetical protein BDV37DRAFT_264129 [Aspergillus pseudonomiae]